jgi:hypothetical protein
MRVNGESPVHFASCPEIEIYPSTSVGIPVTSHKFYTLSGKSRRFLSQSIEVVCRSSVDKDSLSLYLLPCHYILYEGKPVIKDTIIVTFSKRLIIVTKMLWLHQ